MFEMRKLLKKAACLFLAAAVMTAFLPEGFGLGFGGAETAQAASVKSISSASTLRKALTSAEGGSYKLTADIKGLTKAIVMRSKTKSLDLNGHTIKGNVGIDALITVEGGRLTISDSKGGGLVRNTGSRGAISVLGSTKTTVKISGGTFSSVYSCCDVTGGRLLISGGTFRSEKSCAVAGYSGLYSSEIQISGGSFTGYDALSVQGDLDLTVTGGTYKGSHADLTVYDTFCGKMNVDKSLFANIWDDTPAGHGVYETEFKRVPVTYTEGMTVSDADTLYSVYMHAKENLLPKLKIVTTEHLYEVLNVYSLKWGDSVSTQMNTAIEEDVAKIDVDFKYGTEYQVERLILNPAVKSNASAKAVKYYKKICSITKTATKGCKTKKEKVKGINKYIVRSYSYDYKYRKASYSFLGLLDNKKAVCQGFAGLFRLMCIRAGIETESIGGMATSGPGKTDFEPHMWNRSKIGSKWYYTDVTYNEGTGTNKFLLLSEKSFYGKGYHY